MIFNSPFTLAQATEREWLITNGLGGYASSSLCGMNTRRYHGLLVAALAPPGGRTLLVAKLEEQLSVGGESFLLSTNQYPGAYYPGGYKLLREVEVTGERVAMRFVAGGAEMEKTISMTPGENSTLVGYRNIGTVPIILQVTPLVNARDFHGETGGEIDLRVQEESWLRGAKVNVSTSWLGDGFWIYAGVGEWRDYAAWYRNMLYVWEQRRGLTDSENHFSPGHFTFLLAPGEQVSVFLSTTAPPMRHPLPAASVELPILAEVPEEIRCLQHATQSFLVQRGVGEQVMGGQDDRAPRRGRTVIAGYHWFGDWGRDTMIALPGLCLSTGQQTDAADILRTFAAARRRGLLPNLFLDSGTGEAYNTVDASLWFVYAVERYYQATQDQQLVEELRPALEEVIFYYRYGTDFGICMDRDALIEATAPGWQLTWMDAKVGEWVVTPRMGKPVEINALWYNALRVMETFARDFDWQGDYGALAERARKSFGAFWYAEGNYLYDVLAATPDHRLRPNQIFAVSLPYSPLEETQARAVLNAVESNLLTPYGLRTLAPGEAEYRGHYGGNVTERDGAYHQGTVWAWLIGAYIDAYLRVNGDTAETRAAGRQLLQPLLAHVREAGIGTISEIFDGDAPHLPCGAISQAWSVAEVLRAWERVQGSGSQGSG